jgi:DNA-binding transcriptional ArsR family regulator
MVLTDSEVAALLVPYDLAFSRDLRPSDVRIYLALSHFIRGGLERPTRGGLAELAGVSLETAKVSVVRLEDAGFIEIEREAQPHRYRLAS